VHLTLVNGIINFLVLVLFFTLPLGLGLLLLRSLKQTVETFGKASYTLIALFWGWIFFASIVYFLEYNGYLILLSPFLIFIYLFLSTCGFIVHKKEIKAIPYKKCFRIIIYTLPAIIISYFFFNLTIADYPFAEIFQNVHQYQIAQNIGQHSYLNLYKIGTYVSFFPIHLGIITHYFPFHPIILNYMVKFFAYLLTVFVTYNFYNSYLKKKYLIIPALLFVTLLSVNVGLENGTIVCLLSTLFLTIFINIAKQQKNDSNQTQFFYLYLIAVFSGYILSFFMKIRYDYYFIFYLTLIFLNTLINIKKWNILLLFFILGTLFNLYHRQSLMFLFASTIVAIIYFELTAKNRNIDNFVLGIKKSFFFVSLTLVSIFLIYKSNKIYFERDFNINFNDFITNVYSKIFNKPTLSLLDTAGGFRNILVEFIRLYPPPILFFIFFIYTITSYKNIILNTSYKKKSFFITTIFIFSISLAFSLNPFPYSYRYLTISLLFALPLIYYYLQVFTLTWKKILIFLIPFSYSILITTIYYSGKLSDTKYLQYFKFIEHFNISLLIVSLGVFTYSIAKKSKLFFFISLTLILSLNCFQMKNLFYFYSFGKIVKAHNGKITHFTKEEVQAAFDLNKIKGRNTILISDPATLGIFIAVNGLETFYTYPNLIIESAELQNDLKFFLNSSLDSKINNEGINFRKMKSHLSAEAKYMLSKDIKLEVSDSILSKNMLFIFTNRTINFMRSSDPDLSLYHPINEVLTKNDLTMIHHQFDVLVNINDKVIVAKSKKILY